MQLTFLLAALAGYTVAAPSGCPFGKLFERGELSEEDAPSVDAAGLALAGAALTVPTAAHAADDTIGISAAPAGPDGSADGRTRFSYAADPGQKISDQYVVRNTGTTVQTFTVLSTDAFNDEAGEGT